MDPDALMRRAAAGDEACFTELVIAVQHRLRAFLAVRAPDADLVEELVQSAFVALWEQRARWNADKGAVSAWLMGIARNQLAAELRRRRRVAGLDAVNAAFIDQCLAADAGSQGEDETLPRLRNCLERLGASARQLIELRYDQERSMAELAELTARPAKHVAVALFRIRRSLERCLAGQP